MVAEIWLHVEVCNNDIQVCCNGTYFHSVCIKPTNSISKYWKKLQSIHLRYSQITQLLNNLCKFTNTVLNFHLLSASLLLCKKYLLQFCISEMTGFIRVLGSTFSDAPNKKIDSWCCRRWSFNPIWKLMHKLNKRISITSDIKGHKNMKLATSLY